MIPLKCRTLKYLDLDEIIRELEKSGVSEEKIEMLEDRIDDDYTFGDDCSMTFMSAEDLLDMCEELDIKVPAKLKLGKSFQVWIG